MFLLWISGPTDPQPGYEQCVTHQCSQVFGILIDEGILKVDKLKIVTLTLGNYKFFLDKQADPGVLTDCVLHALKQLYECRVAPEVLKITDALKKLVSPFILEILTVHSPVYSDGTTLGK
ncbi:hypothetical protein F5146DRAFT_1142580 [Armillaria mellea]|nr:hypothetical protein F5146DRAFT_1142580 [Armillaria mellea]